MLWVSYERIIVKYTLAKESGLISSINYMGKMSVWLRGLLGHPGTELGDLKAEGGVLGHWSGWTGGNSLYSTTSDSTSI